MKWNNDWRDELKKTNEGCYIRLCECRNTRNDIIIMAKLVKKYNPTMTAEDCFIYMLEWVGDWNGQFEVTDWTDKEFKKALDKVKKV